MAKLELGSPMASVLVLLHLRSRWGSRRRWRVLGDAQCSCAQRGLRLPRGFDVASRLPMAPVVVGDLCLQHLEELLPKDLGQTRCAELSGAGAIPELVTGAWDAVLGCCWRPSLRSGIMSTTGLQHGASLVKSIGRL